MHKTETSRSIGLMIGVVGFGLLLLVGCGGATPPGDMGIEATADTVMTHNAGVATVITGPGVGVATQLAMTSQSLTTAPSETPHPTMTPEFVGLTPDEPNTALFQQTATALIRAATQTAEAPVVQATEEATEESAEEAVDPFSLTATQLVREATQMAEAGLAASPTAPPVEIAELPLVVRSEAGAEIGNGRMLVYYPDTIAFPNTARVELELAFNNYYITPTPRGRRTVIPVASPTIGAPTARPESNRPSPTPRSAQFEGDDDSVEFYERMGATLICLPTSFDGCEEQSARRVTLAGASWTWIIRPQEDLSGWQDLRLALWRPVTVNGESEQEVLWDYAFQIEVGTGGGLPTGAIFALVVAVAVAIVGGVLNVLRGRSAAPTTPGAGPNVFISYRRGGSAGYANMLHDRLEARGADVFLDVDDIHAGSFSETIRERIETADFFIVMLAPSTLDSIWVMKEIEHAREHSKTIIPVLVNGFDLYSSDLPEDMIYLQTQQAVEMLPQYVDAAVDKIATYVGLSQ